MEVDLNLEMIECIQGKNPCFLKDRRITGLVAPLAHDVGCYATHAGRFAKCPEFLEEKGKYVNNGNGWNSITTRKMVHGIAGVDADGKWLFAQMLPFDVACWGCAGGKNGSYNYPPTKANPKQFAHIQSECCQDDKKSKEFYENAMDTMAKFFAWTIQQGICSSDVNLVTCHREAHKLGFGGNHGDILDWASKFGQTEKTYMADFKARVQKYLDAGKIQVTWRYGSQMNAYKKSSRYSPTARYLQTCLNRLGYVCETDGLLWNETETQLKKFQKDWGLVVDGDCGSITWSALMDALNGKKPPEPPKVQIIQHYTGVVKTASSGYIGLYTTNKKKDKLVNVKDGQVVEVFENNSNGTIAKARYGNRIGYIDTQYLVNRVYIYDDAVAEEHPTEEEPKIPDVQHYKGTVKTRYGHGINLWKTTLHVGHVCSVPEGSIMEITSDCISGTLAPAKYGVYNGYADTQYIVDRVNIN